MLKNIKKIFYLLIILSILFLIFSPDSFAAEPKLVTTLNKAFEKIEDWILKLATPVAAVAVCCGLFMKKFSFR